MICSLKPWENEWNTNEMNHEGKGQVYASIRLHKTQNLLLKLNKTHTWSRRLNFWKDKKSEDLIVRKTKAQFCAIRPKK